MNANEAVVRCIDALNELGVPYLLGGGYAANFYGIARSTKDADFVVEITGDQLAELPGRLGARFLLDRQMRFETVTATQRVVFSLADLPFKVEFFLLSDDEFDQSRFKRRICVRSWDRDVFLPTPEDLLIMKLRWSRQGQRAKDLDDARNVIAVQASKLDWPYVESWCDRHGTRELLERVRSEAADV